MTEESCQRYKDFDSSLLVMSINSDLIWFINMFVFKQDSKANVEPVKQYCPHHLVKKLRKYIINKDIYLLFSCIGIKTTLRESWLKYSFIPNHKVLFVLNCFNLKLIILCLFRLLGISMLPF